MTAAAETVSLFHHGFATSPTSSVGCRLLGESMKIMFICSGNTCRSPMAAALFEKSLTKEQKENLEIKSAGVSTFGGDGATEGAFLAMKSRGIDLSEHRSTALRFSDLSDTDLFVCMSDSHRLVLLANGVSAEKIICLDVSDPFGSDNETYEKCAEEIDQKLNAVRERIKL